MFHKRTGIFLYNINKYLIINYLYYWYKIIYEMANGDIFTYHYSTTSNYAVCYP
jgi:hypothetical protein